MKKLNKKGFTLVELLAVIVILALLIVIVANTALPALNSSKLRTLETYAKRVAEEAKTVYTTDCVLTNNTGASATGNCASSHSWSITDIMGADAANNGYSSALTISYSNNVVTINGTVEDTKNNNTVTITNSVTGTATAK